MPDSGVVSMSSIGDRNGLGLGVKCSNESATTIRCAVILAKVGGGQAHLSAGQHCYVPRVCSLARISDVVTLPSQLHQAS
ncbi:unnamed protein product [Leptidea sinapis]|uniref:Uncharacterized protein n=1 Tax=Leptidea sinapis TaxID=189913 RepID=A0A5E4PNY2_9NEOP|nr:unnamed protein product [Leptidea sinapis]